MLIKEIYQNLDDDEKIITPKETIDKISKLEDRLTALEQGEGYLKLSNDFSEVISLISENCFVQGFKAGVQMMAESMDNKS